MLLFRIEKVLAKKCKQFFENWLGRRKNGENIGEKHEIICCDMKWSDWPQNWFRTNLNQSMKLNPGSVANAIRWGFKMR